MKIHPAQLWRSHKTRKLFLGKEGTVISFSVVHQGPVQLEKRTPYVVALVEVGKERVVAQLVDCVESELKIGMRAIGVMRRMFDTDADALHFYGVKFSPIRENPTHTLISVSTHKRSE